jgi:hypothetical protein
MIIRSANGDDLTTIQDMEVDLCRKHRVGRKLLYPTLRHADFHRTYQDSPEHWNAAAYAAFSGEVLMHKLGFEQLKSLYSDFTAQRLLLSASWANVVFEELLNLPAAKRAYRNHIAIALRYACAVADDYVFPESDLLRKFTAAQFEQFNAYLEYVATERRIPACTEVRLACARQLNDLARSHR